VKKRIVIVVFVALLLGVIALVYVAEKNLKGDEVYYSGTIEARPTRTWPSRYRGM
jgi:hypothetical protein